MTTFAENIYNALAGNAGLSALVGTRIYPDVAPQGVARPFVVWQEISDVPQNGLDGSLGLDAYRLQLTCWDRTGLGARNARDAAVLAMAAATAFSSLLVDLRSLPWEQDTQLHGVQADFSVWLRS